MSLEVGAVGGARNTFGKFNAFETKALPNNATDPDEFAIPDAAVQVTVIAFVESHIAISTASNASAMATLMTAGTGVGLLKLPANSSIDIDVSGKVDISLYARATGGSADQYSIMTTKG